MRQLARRDDEPPSILDAIVRRFRLLTRNREQEEKLKEALEDLNDEAGEEEDHPFTPEQRTLVLNALSFGELRVGDVMIPRADIRGVAQDADLHEVVQGMKIARHTRLVVYRGTLDDVLGIVHLKDLLDYWGDGARFTLSEIVRSVLVVPPSMRVTELLIEMRNSGNHVAIVVDEFGGTDGLVTIEDLVAEIVGELHAEGDVEDEPQLVNASDGSIEADARVELETLEERLGVDLLSEDERDEADTLGGLIFSLVDRVPAPGEVVQHPSGYAFEMIDVDPRRIKRVRIRKVAEAESGWSHDERDAS